MTVESTTGGNDPLSPEEFDQWAAKYDVTVPGTGFPFDGYQQVMARIVALAPCRSGESLLDLGTGTGNVLAGYSLSGGELWGSDFSTEMLKVAAEKLPRAHLVLADLRNGWPEMLNRRFNWIVSAYTFHHFDLSYKVQLCTQIVRDHLLPKGRLVIADISFRSLAELEAVRVQAGEAWDDELYWVADETLARLTQAGLAVEYFQESYCAGIYAIQDTLR